MASQRASRSRKAAQLPGDWVDAHKPIISDEVFAQVQVALKTRRRGRKPDGDSGTVEFLFRGVARCAECGATITGMARWAKGRHKVGYYICRAHLGPADRASKCPRSVYMRQPESDAQVAEQVLTFTRTLLKSLTRPPRQQARPDFEGQRQRSRAGKQRVIELVKKGLMAIDDVAKAVNDIDDELAAIDAQEAEYKATAGNDTVESRKARRGYCQQVIDEWPALSTHVRRGIITAFAAQILVGKDKSIRITWRDPSDLASAYADNKMPPLRAPSAVPALPEGKPSILSALLNNVPVAVGVR
jgi:hypothetical protein